MPRVWDEDFDPAEKKTGPEMSDGLESDPVPRSLLIPRVAPPKPLRATVDDVIQFGRDQMKSPTQNWTNLCLSFCRQSYGVRPFAPSAIKAWHKVPAKYKHVGGKPSAAPRGAMLFYAGGAYGHVAIAIGKKTSNKCLSNDYVRRGKIDPAPRTFPRWGLTYLGWSNWTPWGTLDLDA
jgi:hypothetical protein